MKKVSLIALVIFIAGALLALIIIDDVEIALSEAQVQAAIDEKIALGPIESRGVKFTIKKAVVDFRAIDDSAMIDIDFKAEGFGFSGNMTGDIASGIDYKEPIIYLSNLRPGNIEVVLDDNTATKLDEYKSIAKDYLAQKRQEMLSEKAKKSLDNAIKREGDQVKAVAALGLQKFFETLPIYDLNHGGTKGHLASLALKDVRFTDDKAIVTLSPLQAVLKILGMIFSFLTMCLFAFYQLGGGALIDNWINSRRMSERDDNLNS